MPATIGQATLEGEEAEVTHPVLGYAVVFLGNFVTVETKGVEDQVNYPKMRDGDVRLCSWWYIELAQSVVLYFFRAAME